MEKEKLINTIKEGYIYGLPIVGMYEYFYSQVLDTKTKLTNINEFYHINEISSPKTSFVPAPNNDTTYSRAWLDLREEPVVITVPDTNNRFYTIHMLDLFSETITNIGKRLNGTVANNFVIVGPNWKGELPEGMSIIKSNTTLVLAFLRILVNEEKELSMVKELQNGFNICYLSEYKNKTKKKDVSIESFPEYKNNNYYDFFKTLNAIFNITPKIEQDTKILNEMKAVGILSDNIPNFEDGLLKKTCDDTEKLIDEGGMDFGEVHNYWRIARTGIGNYGNDYFQRAVVWYKGALANQPEESMYPSTFQDENGELLDGKYNYEIKFEKGNFPPVSQFWSVTMYYFSNAFLVDNEINRYSIGNRTQGLYFDEDGSLTIYIQNKCPKSETKKINWLPSPDEKFYLTLRLYGPSNEAISGKWLPPIVKKVSHKV